MKTASEILEEEERLGHLFDFAHFLQEKGQKKSLELLREFIDIKFSDSPGRAKSKPKPKPKRKQK